MNDQPLVWKRKLTASAVIAGAVTPVVVVQELSGVTVRCGRCGRLAASIRRRGRGPVNHYTHCRYCRKDSWLSPYHLIQRVAEVDPGLAARLAEVPDTPPA